MAVADNNTQVRSQPLACLAYTLGRAKRGSGMHSAGKGTRLNTIQIVSNRDKRCEGTACTIDVRGDYYTDALQGIRRKERV